MKTALRLLSVALFATLCQSCSPFITTQNGNKYYDDSNISRGMRDTLWDDAARLALNEAIATDSAFIDTVTIPPSRIQFYYQDLVNLYNANDIPARDSVFRFYPVQPLEPELHLLYIATMLFSDTVSDSTIQSVRTIFHLDSVLGQPRELRSPIPCNTIALAELISQTFPSLEIEAEGYGTTGGCLSDIFVKDSAGFRFYTFRYCLEEVGFHDWNFTVFDGGGVKYTGSDGDNVPPR